MHAQAETRTQDTTTQTESEAFAEQVEQLYVMIEQLEDGIAASNKREQAWGKEKKQLLDAKAKLAKKLESADDDVKFIKERFDQLKKERERIIAAAKKEQEKFGSEIKQLREHNKQLKKNMERVTAKLDTAIVKIGELIE